MMHTDIQLPQSYEEFNGIGSDGITEVAELERLDQIDITLHSDLQSETARVKSLVLAKAHEVLGDASLERVSLMKLRPDSGDRVGIKNHAGFRVIDEQALLKGQLDKVDLVSVFLVKRAGSRDEVIPIVVAHESGQGGKIKRLVDESTKNRYGAVPEELIKPRTRAFLEHFAHAVSQNWGNTKDRVLSWFLPIAAIGAIGTLLVGFVGSCARSFRSDYLDDLAQSVTEVQKVGKMSDESLKKGVIDHTIKYNDYENIFSSDAPREARLASAKVVGQLIKIEYDSGRLEIPDGPTYHSHENGYCQNLNQLQFKTNESKVGWIASKLVERIAEEKDPEIHQALVDAYESSFAKK